jgi:hypothetical protein
MASWGRRGASHPLPSSLVSRKVNPGQKRLSTPRRYDRRKCGPCVPEFRSSIKSNVRSRSRLWFTLSTTREEVS